jgi:hypothetical protein
MTRIPHFILFTTWQEFLTAFLNHPHEWHLYYRRK